MFKTWDELSYKEQLECTVWDAYKDAHGFRPRHMNLQAMSEEELKAELEYLETVIHQNAIEQNREEQAAIVRFEARVQSTIDAGAKDRETAIRWIRSAEDADYGDDDYLCYNLGLPYGYFKKEVDLQVV